MHVLAGLDFGVVLVRNSERSKQLFSELVEKSQYFQVRCCIYQAYRPCAQSMLRSVHMRLALHQSHVSKEAAQLIRCGMRSLG